MTSPQFPARWAAVAAAALLVGSLSPVSAAADDITTTASSADVDELSIEANLLASGLQRPTAMAAPDDGSDRLFITEMGGTVRTYHPDEGLAEDTLLDISDRVQDAGNEQGLLGIAFAPDFADDPALYLSYTSVNEGELTLSRITLDSPDDDPVHADAEEVLLTQEHPEFTNHNGGQVDFDGEGHLYWSLGDGGGAGDPFDAGQDTTTLLGTIVRLDVGDACADLAYCVPEDNPFVGDPDGLDEIWAYGLRNAWKFSVDPVDDSLWIGDVGQAGWEEVNHMAPDEGGANFGWSCMEGPVVFDEDQCFEGETLVDPVFAYQLTGANCAIVGGQVYRGETYADVAGGVYVAVDYCSGYAWGVTADDGTYATAEIGEVGIQPTTVGADADGELYIVTDLPGQLHALSFSGAPTCVVDYTTTDWEGGFTAAVRITTDGEEATDGWELEFDFADGQTVEHGWGAEWSQDGTTVTAGNAPWNGRITPGDPVEIGFNGTWTQSNSAPEVFTLDGEECAIS